MKVRIEQSVVIQKGYGEKYLAPQYEAQKRHYAKIEDQYIDPDVLIFHQANESATEKVKLHNISTALMSRKALGVLVIQIPSILLDQ